MIRFPKPLVLCVCCSALLLGCSGTDDNAATPAIQPSASVEAPMLPIGPQNEMPAIADTAIMPAAGGAPDGNLGEGGQSNDLEGAGGSNLVTGGGAPNAAGGDGGQALDPMENPDPDAPCPRCNKAFNGENFAGWTASPAVWSITDEAMRGVGGPSRLAYTDEDYGSFRLIFESRMAPINGDHLGILFWGDRPQNAENPKIDGAGWLQWMPPFGGMWNYHPPQHKNLPHQQIAKVDIPSDQWSLSEVLCDLEKGTLRAAVNGVETTFYQHPTPLEREDPETRIIAGPIGMFRHGGGASEYKNIYIEADPTEDKLYTLK